ncbi:MAG: hypothetical protein J6X55_09390 [Victivallales bacterium]|nr:hypothetical protein [Victivallales bacterium]
MRLPLSTISIAVLALLFLAGCETVELPPGFARVGEVLQNNTSEAASDEAVFSLMEWYAIVNRGKDIPPLWSEYVQNKRMAAQSELFGKWKQNLIEQSHGTLVHNPEKCLSLIPKALLVRTDWETLETDIHSIKVLLESPITIEVPLKECLNDSFWRGRSAKSRESFAEWGQQRRLTVPPAENLNTSELVAQLSSVHDAILLSKSIHDALASAADLSGKKQFIDAMNALQALLEKLKTDSIAKQFDELKEESPLRKLDQAFQQLPFTCINVNLQNLETTFKELNSRLAKPFTEETNTVKAMDASLTQVETTISTMLTTWRQDKRFTQSWQVNVGKIRTTLAQTAALRLAVWKQQLSDFFSSRMYWDAALFYKARCEALTFQNHSQFGLYSSISIADGNDTTFTQTLAKDFRTLFLKRLPDACGLLADSAEKSLKDHQESGYAIALCRMVNRMIELLNAHDYPGIAAPLAKTSIIEPQARKSLEDAVLKRVITIEDMSSAIPGLGLTYTKDLQHSLERLFKSYGMDNYLKIVSGTAQMTPYSYRLHDGVVANFDGQEDVERKSIRILRRFGEIKQSPNPEARDNPSAPPTIYTQELYEHIINIREIERIAHVRVFITVRGPGFTSPVEVNEFYSKRFIIEESHPFNDVRVIDVLKTYDLNKHPVQDAEPTLRYDRIWTPGEMLDWARKDSLSVFSLKLLYHFNQFPLLLENTAKRNETEGKLENATENWACCLLLTENSPTESFPANDTNDTVRPAAKCTEECLNCLQKQRTALEELKRNADGNLLQTASKLFNSRK